MKLLDINLLIALIWTDTTAHDAARRWRSGQKLAICPLTELGFLRVSMSPAFNATGEQARTALKDFLEAEKPAFIPADLRALESRPASSYRQTTDLYLADLAARHGAKLATLDAGIKHPAIELVAAS